MTWPLLIGLYCFIAGYALVTYWLGELVAIGTVVLGFGLLIIPYLALEWVATPMIAVVMGFYSRWSVGVSLMFGAPLLVAFTCVTPVVSSGNPTLSVPVPWLSVYAKSKDRAVPVIQERLLWWGSLFAGAMVAGLVSRKVKRVQQRNDG